MLVYFACYGAGMLFASSAHYYLSGFSLMFSAVCLYLRDYRKSKNPLHLRALFSLSWVGGQGISCLKLSRLQGTWEPMTWACFFVAFTAFWGIFGLVERQLGPDRAQDGFSPAGRFFGAEIKRNGERNLFLAVMILTAAALAAFLFEAAVLGYVPLFVRGVPHAYSYFHISGVHYVTVSCVLTPSLCVLYLRSGQPFAGDFRAGGTGAWSSSRFRDAAGGFFLRRAAVCAAGAVSLLIPILCVSRFQLIFAVFLMVITFMLAGSRPRIGYLVLAALALTPLYIALTVARSHDVAYLNGIFEMKNAATPIFVTQPYIYIANNYDNFDCLVRQLPRHTFGVKSLFPLWALTGLKFVRPELVSFPLFRTKEELTTLTMFYDSYYDFGIAGVFLLAAVLGAAGAYLTVQLRRFENPVAYLFYAQIALYFMLSFFTTWFSNPTTWFYLAVTAAVFLFVGAGRRKTG